ncbi:hypothetical protein E8E14_005036 [Neopestalotiopsis sp. 37M]|nr:hypothetical protein E8E14_005036 [Neopestalotiopsis sp. 37M]
MSVHVKLSKYARSGDRGYYCYIKDKYWHKKTTIIPGGFRIAGTFNDLIVGVPSELARHLATVGITKAPTSSDHNAISDGRIRTAITKFIGELDSDGLHSCVLLSISDEEEDVLRDESEVADVPIGRIIQEDPYAAKIYNRWDPEQTTVVRDTKGNKTTVIFKDDEGVTLAEVHVSDKSDDSNYSNDTD